MRIRFTVTFGLLALSTVATQAQFTAFNDHYAGPGTHANATAWNVYGTVGGAPGNSGPLKDINTGATLPVVLTITTNGGVLGGPGIGVPNPGTPAFNSFNGFIDWGSGGVNHAIQTPAGASVTHAFTGLNPNKRYRYTCTAIRGGGYPNRWTTFTLTGALGFTTAHTAGSLTNGMAGASVAANECVISTGDNVAGDMAVWENIQPASDGSFSLVCTQYMGPVPGGSSDGPYAYSIAAEKLEEFDTTPPPPPDTALLTFHSGWRYFDRGYEPAPNWKQPDYNDEDWPSGNGKFGYGNGDENTTVGYGPDDENKYITTYFRTWIQVPDPSQFSLLTLNLVRDDGAVVYVNGAEVFRSNMPDDDIYYDTFALTRQTYPAEAQAVSLTTSPSLLVAGLNLIAAEVHQYEPVSPDLSFDLEISATQSVRILSVTRGPYLQVGSSSNLVVRWRTSDPSTTRVLYGTNPANLNLGASSAALVTEHQIALAGLLPDTKYFYAIGTSTNMLAGDATYFFTSSPLPGPARPTRIWAIGDFGTGFAAQRNVRDAYYNFTGTRDTDVWLMLGDNAYGSGLDHEYQAYVFNVYPSLLRKTVVWPTVGNHETAQNQNLSDNYDYYRIFSMPTVGQAGGVPSGTQHYYSFDYANIHFICLDSETAIFRQPGGPMAAWLSADLADTSKDWIIAYWHHPPYTRGSHNSDFESDLIEMRANIVPILESYGVDMVLSGHSHNYERSYLINGFYGHSSTVSEANFINHGNGRTNDTGAYLKPAGGIGAGQGTVYVVDGSSGGQFGGGFMNHPAMFYSVTTPGSLIIDINGLQLDATFLSGSGTVDDSFTMIKGGFPGAPPPALKIARANTNALVSWPTSIPDYQLETKSALNDAQWSAVSATVATNGRRKSVSVPATSSNQFFQLRGVP